MTGPDQGYLVTAVISVSYLVWGVLTIGAAIYRSNLAWRNRQEVNQYRRFYVEGRKEYRGEFFWPESSDP